MKLIKYFFEKMLWNSRFIVLFAVIACLGAAFGVFYMATVDAITMLSHLTHYAEYTGEARINLRSETITHVVEIIDGYLLATVLLIFSLGLYELFISKIQEAEESANAPKVLVISNLDDLKARLAKVVLMILIVKFFEHALNMHFQDAMDMLAFAGGIALIGLALYLSHAADGHGKEGHSSDKHHH
jgi:uncharacterized membrane protein YqhA